MIRIFTFLITTLLCLGNLMGQTVISGIINNYGAVTNIDNSNICAPIISVDDATGFIPGDHIMIIQMKGAEMDTTNTPTYGQITNLNSAGLYEKARIESVTGNDILLSTLMTNVYNVMGAVQIVSIPQYEDVTMSGPVYPMVWNGSKGGVIAMEVENTLSLDYNIDASEAGFRGGVRETLQSTCNSLSSFNDQYYTMGDFRGATKGEGIAEYPEMEKGRGPMATGGGGGNDHNTGGGGGANYGYGGIGGQNLTPTTGTCQGFFPGIGGGANTTITNRLFMGGGGGAGHDNNDAIFIGGGTDGAAGGGIIYIKANEIIGWWNYISANGKTLFPTSGFDGGGGGGAGGSILLDIPTLTFGLLLEARGGKGSDMNAADNDICMGPGGGGGGGAIYTDIPFSAISIDISGGNSGVVLTGSCDGSSMLAQAGGAGNISTFPGLVTAVPVEHIAITEEPTNLMICNNETADFTIQTDIPADSYQWQLNNGSGYSVLIDGTDVNGSSSSNLSLSNLSSGTYNVQCIVEGGCDDVLSSYEAVLEVNTSAAITLDPISQTLCEGEPFVLTTDASGNNVAYQWQIDSGSGFSNLMDSGSFSGSNTNTLTVDVDLSMDGYQFQCVASNECPGSDVSNTATLDVNPLAVPDFTYYVSNDTVYINNTSSGGTEYYWDFGDGTPLHPGGTPYYVYENSGTYNVTVYAINDCGTSTFTIPVTINIVVGLYDIDQDVEFSISPNPTSDFIQVDLTGESFTKAGLHLYDVSGKRISGLLTEDNITTMDLSSYPSGMYFLQIVIEGRTSISKVIKK